NNNNINYNRNFSNCYNYYNNFNNYTINYDDKNNNNNNNNIDDDNYKILDLIKPDVLKNLKTPENLTQSKPKKNNQINKFKFIDQTTSIYNKSKNYHHKNHNY
ncbi:MAG: hypothetical protein Q8K60_08555, partial [Parachlamydiaceae bacterium]|nr:hypothetical protein [Parachlamydiaceae bacterium]